MLFPIIENSFFETVVLKMCCTDSMLMLLWFGNNIGAAVAVSNGVHHFTVGQVGGQMQEVYNGYVAVQVTCEKEDIVWLDVGRNSLCGFCDVLLSFKFTCIVLD